MLSRRLWNLVLTIILGVTNTAMSPINVRASSIQDQDQRGHEWTFAPGSDKRLSAIEMAVEELRLSLGAPGLSLVIVKDDQVLLMKGFGLRDVERKLPVTPDTLIPIASATKSFTAMATMMSVDQHILSLEDSPKKFLPYFKLRDPEANAQVTLRDLLSHRTGLMSHADLAGATGVLNREELIRVAGEAKPTARFREKSQYNNVMFAAAGAALAKARHSTWEQVIADLIFKPLGMKASNSSIQELQKSQDFSYGYTPPDESHVNHRLPFQDLSAYAPSSTINSNARDMAKWLRLMLGEGVFNGKRLVSKQSFKELLTSQIKVNEQIETGLGWVLADWHDIRLVLHNGSTDGFYSLVEMIPAKNTGYAMLANVNDPALEAGIRKIIWSNLAGITTDSISPAHVSNAPSDCSTLTTPAGRSQHTSAQKKDGRVLEELPGSYESEKGDASAKLYVKDNHVMMLMAGQPPYTLIGKGTDNFCLAELPGAYSLEVKRDASGNVSAIALTEPNSTMELKRVEEFIASLTVEQLMAKVVNANGGEANMRKHKTMEANITVDFENQGVKADGVILAKAPNSMTTMLTLKAVGKKIGTIREYFDGVQGGDETSFSPSEPKAPSEVENSKVEDDFYRQHLDWKKLFQNVTIKKMAKIGGEEVFVVVKTPPKGPPVVDYVSATSYLVLKREVLAEDAPLTMVYTDYRLVDGALIPFTTTQQIAKLGEVVTQIKTVKFNVAIAGSEFRAKL